MPSPPSQLDLLVPADAVAAPQASQVEPPVAVRFPAPPPSDVATESTTSEQPDDVPSPSLALPPVAPLFGGIVPAAFCSIFAQAAMAPLYWQFLSRLYVATFESDRVRILKEDALNLARTCWREHRERRADADDAIAPDADEAEQRSLTAELTSARSAFERDTAMARYLLGKCQRTGWIHFEFQREFNADAIHFTPTAARTLDTWLREARDEQPPLQGYLLNVRNLLRPATIEERPSVALLTAQRALREFVRELVVMSQDIARSIERVLQEAATPQAVLHEALDRYGRRVSANYHRIKTVENVHRVRAELLHRIDQLAMDAALLERAAAAWVEREDMEAEDAQQLLGDALADMREKLHRLPTILMDLDDRNAKFSGAAWRQLIYLLHQDAQLEAKLEGALRTLHAASEEEGIALEVYRFRGLAHHSEEADAGEVGADRVTDGLDPNDRGAAMTTAFLYRPPAPPTFAAREAVQSPAAEPSLDAAQRLAERLANALTPEHLDRIALDLLGDAPARPMRELAIPDTKDFIRTLVGIAWARRGEGSVRFQRLSCRPREDEAVCGDITCAQCRYTSGPYVLPNGVLLRTATTRRSAASAPAIPSRP